MPTSKGFILIENSRFLISESFVAGRRSKVYLMLSKRNSLFVLLSLASFDWIKQTGIMTIKESSQNTEAILLSLEKLPLKSLIL